MTGKTSEKENDKAFILGGSPKNALSDSKIVACAKCGNKAAVSGANLKRMEKASVLCPDCGAKLLAEEVGTGEPKKIIFPPEAEMEKLINHIMSNDELKGVFVKNLVKETAFCKKCGAELGHLMSNGAFLLNKANIDLKKFSADKMELRISVRRKQDEEDNEESKFGGVS